jgi:CubicO group peptidase (beta-lactamase class C family)
MKKLILLTLLILPAAMIAQEPTKSQQLGTLFRNLYKNGQFNGAILVAEKGKPVYETAMGFSDADGHRLNINSQFALAQITRQFTTMAVMILKEQGKLKYSDDVKKYIPDLPYEGITIYHLLTFTDGLPYIGDLGEKARDTEKRKGSTAEYFVRLLIEHEPKADSPPGQKLGWNGTGSILMAYIIEKVSGEPYSDFLEKHIFDPLKMDHTHVYDPAAGEELKDRAHVIKTAMNGEDIVANDHPEDELIGDSGIYSTLSDMLKWDRGLYTEKLVKKETLKQAFAPAKLDNGELAVDDASRIPGLAAIGEYNFGFGWDLDTLYGSRVAFHGGFPPNGSFMFRNPDKDRMIILLTNNSTQNAHLYHFKIFDRVLKIMNGRRAEPIKLSIGDKVGSVLVSKGINEAIGEYNRLKKSGSDIYDLDDPFALAALGRELLDDGRTDDAIAVLELNAAEFLDFPASYFLLVRSYMSKNDLPAAKKAVEKVIELNPDAERPKQMLKMIEAKMKDTAQ